MKTIVLSAIKLSLALVLAAVSTGCASSAANMAPSAPQTSTVAVVHTTATQPNADVPETLVQLPKPQARIAEHFIPLKVSSTDMPDNNKGREGWTLVALTDSQVFDSKQHALDYAKAHGIHDLRVSQAFVARRVEAKRSYEELRKQNLAARPTSPVAILATK